MMKKALLFLFMLASCMVNAQDYSPGRIVLTDPGYVAGATFRPSFDQVPSNIFRLYSQRIYVTFTVPVEWPTWISMNADYRTAIPTRIDWGDGTYGEYEDFYINRTMPAGTHHVVISYEMPTMNPTFLISSFWATSVDVHDAPTLYYLDVNSCPRLSTLITAGADSLAYINFSQDTALHVVDFSSNHKLHDILASKNGLTGIDVNGFQSLDLLFLDSSKALTSIRSSNNVVTEITCKGCDHLQYIYADNSLLEYLTVTGCTVLYYMELYGNPTLQALDVSGAGALSNLNVTGASLSEAAITALIGTMKDRVSLGSGSCNIVPMADGFPASLTIGQQNALTTKNWTEL
jgi:hypothetical protein